MTRSFHLGNVSDGLTFLWKLRAIRWGRRQALERIARHLVGVLSPALYRRLNRWLLCPASATIAGVTERCELRRWHRGGHEIAFDRQPFRVDPTAQWGLFSVGNVAPSPAELIIWACPLPLDGTIDGVMPCAFAAERQSELRQWGEASPEIMSRVRSLRRWARTPWAVAATSAGIDSRSRL